MDLKSGEVMGYESLIRSPAIPLEEGAEALFEAAAEQELTERLDITCIKKAMKSRKERLKDPDVLNFINICPSTLLEYTKNVEKLEELVANCPPTITVFEITEVEDVKEQLASLYLGMGIIKDLGYKIAVDDIASGYNRLQLIVELNPHYIKIDRTLVSGCHKKKTYKKALRFIKNLSEDFGAETIAEGIEKKEELEVLREIGIDHGQGYYIAAPGRAINKKIIREGFFDGRLIQTGTGGKYKGA